MGWRNKRWPMKQQTLQSDDVQDLDDMFSKLWPHKMMLEPSRYDKWSGGGGGGSNGGWAPSRDRDRERERERLARAHQMSNAHPPEQDASSLFSAPFRVVGGRDSQQIQTKLGDYQLAKTLLDDPSKSIGICAEPQSPAPCQQSSRRENEFKKPNQTPQNGRIHHRQSVHNKSGEVTGSSATSLHRPPPLRIPNGFQHQNSIDSSQPPIESILKEMKSLPAPLEVIAATPRKELDNKFIFNPYTNKVQENTQVTNNDLKLISTKPGLDNRISNSRSSVSPERVIKEPVLSESDDDAAATTTRLPTIISPIGTGSPSSDSTSPSPSPSPSPSSSSPPSSPERPVPLAPPRLPEVVPSLGWSLSNFINPSAQFARDLDTEDKGQVQHALDHVKEKPSPISELSDTSVSSHSPADRRRTSAKRQSPLSSDDERTTNHNASVSGVHVGSKRGRPPKGTSRGGSSGDTGVTGVTGVTGDTGDTGVKRRRGRPPKSVSQAPLAPQDHMVHTPPQETKLQIFRKLFTVKKGDECGGKGGKGGKGKGGKGKGQVTIIEVNNETPHRVPPIEDVLHPELHTNRSSGERVIERVTDRLPDRLSESSDRLSASSDRLSASSDRLSASSDRLSGCSDRVSPSLDRGEAGTGYVRGEAGTGYVRGEAGTGYVRAEADVGPPSARNTDVGPQRPRGLWVQVPLSRLRAATVRVVSAPGPGPGLGPGLGLGPGPGLGPGTGPGPASLHTPPRGQGTLTTVEDDRTTNHERTPIYFSYFERLPPDALQDEERDHKYYLSEAKRLRTAAEKEQELLQKIMLYLESVLCFVLTGRVLELELETKKAFTIYRETIEYIKSIHSMPQRFRASPHTTFSKLDILSLRVQALLYLRMFKMYNREVKDYYKIVQEYQQKPALAESVSPVSPSPSPATSVTSVCSGTSSGYCSLAHSVPALAHNALLQLTKYYTFLYVAHDLWEQADCLCRLPANQDLFIAVDRKCGPLTLFSTFRHLVQYVRHAISLLKHAPRE